MIQTFQFSVILSPERSPRLVGAGGAKNDKIGRIGHSVLKVHIQSALSTNLTSANLQAGPSTAAYWLEADAMTLAIYEIAGYSITVAEVRDLEVSPEFHRRGMGTQMLERAESVARRYGPDVLRSETGVDNVASQKLHEGYGFAVYRL